MPKKRDRITKGVKTIKEQPFFVEVDDNGCPECSSGRTYLVVGPDGVASSTSYSDDADAAHLAESLCDAYWQGRNSRKRKRNAR